MSDDNHQEPRDRVNPFAQLLGTVPVRLPKSPRAALVIDGRLVRSKRDIPLPEDDPELDTEELQRLRAEALRLRAELDRLRNQQRWARIKADPEQLAKRKAWEEAHREWRRAYKREYDRKHRAHIRQLQTAWANRNYHANPELARAKQREYYARNREAVLARLKAKRDAAKASQATTTPKGPTDDQA